MIKLRIASSTLFLASSILFYIFLLQLENIASYYQFHSGEVSLISEGVVFFISQSESLLFCFTLIVLFSFIVKSKRGEWIAFILSIFFLVYLTFDQLFFTLYLDHIRYGFDPEGQSFEVGLLIDSLLSIVDYRFFVNLLVVVGLVAWNYRSVFRKESKVYSINLLQLKTCVLLIVFCFYIGVSFFAKDPTRKEFQNAFFRVVKSGIDGIVTKGNPSYQTDGRIENLYTPIVSTSYLDDKRLQGYLNKKKNKKKKYNIIYIVLESVGAMNLVNGANVDSIVAPNLYAMRKQAIVFPSLHCLFPSTTRSHIPIISGGNAITYGSVSEIKKKYKGPTLISELKKAHYRTGIFTAQFMNFEELDSYYHLQEFDKEYMPETMPDKVTRPMRLNSWGVDEKEPMNALIQWIGLQKGTPFFAEFMNVGTHHPYSVPKEYKGPFDAKDDIALHKNAIHYTDNVLGQLISYLKISGLYESTLIIVSGDHGEAFGDRHYGNFLHKNFLYEENVRNFLLVLDPEEKEGPLVSNKKGFIGDIAPTILSYVSDSSTNVFPGQNLFSKSYEPRIHYFSKSSYPELWGLVDGDWKFIVEKIDNRMPELYNLKDDPTEKRNLAAKYPERVDRYQRLLPNWYVQKNKEYTSLLEGYTIQEKDELKVSEVQRPGPKNLLFGNMIGSVFTKKEIVHPKEKIYAWTRVVPFAENIHLRYRWISPTGKITESDFYFDKEWSTAWKSFERIVDMEEGRWECQILKGNEILIRNSFQVSSEVKLFDEYFYTKGPVKLYIGIREKEGFINLEEIHPNENLIAFSQINPYSTYKQLRYEWISPSGKKFNYSVPCEAGWNYTWLYLNEGEPMEQGMWSCLIYDGKLCKVQTTFTISSKAKLFYPYKNNITK